MRTSRVRLLVACVAVFFALVACGEASGGVSTIQNTTGSSTAPTKAPPKVYHFGAAGDQNTSDFTAASAEWTIDWTCNPKTSYGVAPVFGYNIATVSGDPSFSSVLVTCDSSHASGTSTEHGTGTYYFQVNTGTDWTITVTDGVKK